ncbi:proteasome-type protease [Hyphomonas johnsonii]|uniref:Proteasome-type protease n=1 Tax=Hyphomonas johnsonii MHS-2 TaxID=1280950 RepID=A0A059FRE6_9PROT|nr:proteasome-type protease [Hyphomonas johnsonii]KCZ93187.1 proteasome-type protease [Hyphomonas johnsonii MHS-2]
MTYCVALRLDQGLLFMSDTRTNAGVDNVSTFRKMFTWSVEGDRVITIMTAGNLATTQAVISLLNERSVVPADRKQTLLAAPTMFQVARLVGDTLKEIIHSQAEDGQNAESTFGATMIVGGQIKGMDPRLFLIYPEGNFIEASDETPFFQAGETKYGRPIILRAFDPAMSFEEAIKLLYVSFDSTLKANLAVGMPLDMHAYEADTFETGMQRRIPQDDPYFQSISTGWGEALRAAFMQLPDFTF